MDRFEELIKLGYSSNVIESYINENKLVINGNNLFINNYNLLFDIINKTDDNFVLRHFTAYKINYQLYELFRLIRIGKYEIAHKLAERIYEENQIHNLNYNKDKIDYIIEEERYDSEEVINFIKEKELDILLDFYMGNIDNGGEKLCELFSLYVKQIPIEFKAYVAYLTKIDELASHHTMINKRNEMGASGDPLAIVTGLLIQDDFYRAHRVLKEYYIENVESEYSIIWEILRLLDTKLMVILNDNLRNVKKQIELNSNGLNDLDTIVGKYDLSSLSDEQISKMKKEDTEIDDKVNYYKIYSECLAEHKYAEAKDAIKKYQYVINKRGLPYNIDHLIFEVDVKKDNYEKCSEDELKLRDELVNKANDLLDEFKYQEALDTYRESLKYEKHKSPYTLSKMAECYLRLGKYNDAYITYRLQEKDFLYPDDYEYYVECLYRMKVTDKIEYYVNKYEETYHIDSAFMHYILSLVDIGKKNYKKALDEISTCEIISMEENGLPLNFRYERNIISALMNGKEVYPYMVSDYYSHTFSDKDMDRIIDLDIESIGEGEVIEYVKEEEYDEPLEDMIDYLLTLYKVLKEMDRTSDAKDLLIYLEDIIKSPKLSESDKNNFTQVLKNYRNL